MTSVFWSSDDWQVKRNTLHRFSAFAWEELHRFNSSLKETFILELDPDKCCCFIDVPFRLISTIFDDHSTYGPNRLTFQGWHHHLWSHYVKRLVQPMQLPKVELARQPVESKPRTMESTQFMATPRSSTSQNSNPTRIWKTTATMFDDEPMYGHKFHKTVQPTAWSRRKNRCGLNPLTIPIGLLTRHGASEYGLRLHSEGRFMGIITTRTIAESVFGAQLPKAMRDQGVDIYTLSEHLHRTADPEPIPTKSEDPVNFMSPLIHAVVSKLKELSPTKQDTQALESYKLYRESWKRRKLSSLNHRNINEIHPSQKPKLRLKVLLFPKSWKNPMIQLNHLMRNFTNSPSGSFQEKERVSGSSWSYPKGQITTWFRFMAWNVQIHRHHHPGPLCGQKKC